MKKENMLEELSNGYNENAWNRFVINFPNVERVDVSLKGIPDDIIRALSFIIGYDKIENWIYEEFEIFDNRRPIDMLKKEKETKALKKFIMRMPL